MQSRGLLRADAFHEHEFAIFDAQDHRRFHGVAVFINGDGSGYSGKVLGLGDGIADLGGIGGIGAANGVHQDVSRIVGPGRERVGGLIETGFLVGGTIFGVGTPLLPPTNL